MRIKGPHAYIVIALGLCVKWPLEHFNPLPYMSCVRYVGVDWLLFLIRFLYLIGVDFREDQRTNTTKTHV
jgi:hypothetical protein